VAVVFAKVRGNIRSLGAMVTVTRSDVDTSFC